MSRPIEDYALLADLHTGPLVSRDGSIDWLCLPRFDSPAVFCAILGGENDGHWRISIRDGEVTRRRYIGQSFVLETEWTSPTGTARVTDFMPPSTDHTDLIRHVECISGEVTVDNDLNLAFDYARRTPWTRLVKGDDRDRIYAVAGPDGVLISGPLLRAAHDDAHSMTELEGTCEGHLVGSHSLHEGQHFTWNLAWFPSYSDAPQRLRYEQAKANTLEFWETWSSQVTELVCEPRWQRAVMRSLLVLRALTHAATGGIVAAPTASLPEEFGGVRNWDYRYTWLRDAAFTVQTMVSHGFREGATLWRDWLLRAIAGDPEDLRIMYGLGGELQLPEQELGHLAGYENSAPVRIGNGAAGQYQADVTGEVMVALETLRDANGKESEYSWAMQRNLIEFCIAHFDRPDHGIWEMRGEPQMFTHGRVMMWAAFDRGIKAVEKYGLPGDVDQWRQHRDALHAEIWEHGFSKERNSFVQSYGSTEVDASLLQLPQVGFLPYDDPAMLGTVAAIEADLQSENLMIHRYRTDSGKDGLAGDEYPFLICCFWLVEQYAMSGRREDAEQLMTTLVGCANDLGLLSEEYAIEQNRLAGNFPQAFSHLGLIRAADALAHRQPTS